MLGANVARCPSSSESLSVGVRLNLEALLSNPLVTDKNVRTCFEIERALSEPDFLGVPVGSTLGDVLDSTLSRRRDTSNVASFVRVVLMRAVHCRRSADPVLLSSRLCALKPCKVLIANVGARSAYRTTTPRLVTALGSYGCRVISDDLGLQRVLPIGAEGASWCDVPPLNLPSWRKASRWHLRQWSRTIRFLRRSLRLSAYVAARLNDAMLVATQRIARYEKLLELLRPSVLLVDYDRNVRSSCLVFAARRRGIPTFTLMHGVINGPLGYTPVLADRVLCWGEIQRKQLISYGVKQSHVEVVGCDRLEKDISENVSNVRRRFGIEPTETVALLATNPIEEIERIRLVEVFCRAATETAGIRGFVRLHPSESLEDYSHVVGRFPMVTFLGNEELSPDEAFSLADAVVVHSSGFGTEAIVRGKIAIVLDVLSSPIGNGEVLVELAGAPRITSGEGLENVLGQIHRDGSFRESLQRAAEKYTNTMFAAFGEDATRNIASSVLRCVRQESSC